jgi:hypothetical protein
MDRDGGLVPLATAACPMMMGMMRMDKAFRFSNSDTD